MNQLRLSPFITMEGIMNYYLYYRKNAYRDLAIITVFALVSFMIASITDAFELFFEFSRQHDDWEIDEIAIALIISAFSFAFFAWQRWRELRQELVHRQQIEKQLEIEKEKAEMANRAKSAFLANMSHELRTPLNGVLGYAQILSRDKTLTQKQLEWILIIQRSGDYLLTLINDILDLSKIEAGKVELDRMDFNFEEFIRGIVELFQMKAQQKGIDFIYEPLSQLPVSVHGDEKRLRQILINLIGNALKFTEKGRVILRIDTPALNRVCFQVKDSGIGVAPEDIEKIFQPFQQVGDSQYRSEGTGLGLPITKKLVEMMGGYLKVDSTLGQGSTFWIEIDLPTVAIHQPVSKTEPTIIGFTGKTPTLLIIDDQKENRLVLIDLLTPLGFNVVEAENGTLGIAKAREIIPDLILLDLVMPEMDGFETARRLRSLPEFRQVAIIAISASAFDYYQQESLMVGCNAFLSSPIQVPALLKLLGEYLKISFIYEENCNDSVKEMMSFTGPTVQQAKMLLEFALKGDIAEILKELETLEKQEPSLTLFVNQVRQLAKSFQEEQICEFLERVITKDGFIK